jgi:hypothetical protein
MEQEIIKIDKYIFRIKSEYMKYGDYTIGLVITIGGDYDKCASVSYSFNNNKAISACLPHLLYEPECTIGSDLEKSGGTVKMIKALLEYAHKKVPEIHTFTFDDMSKIECVEKNLSEKPPRKLKDPIDLYYFSIAFHGMTWYELNFNAKMKDRIAYENYKKALNFLTYKDAKPALFKDFLEIAQPKSYQIEYLKEKYEKTETYRDFFNSIPKSDRCKYLQHWLTHFMKNRLSNTFKNYDWEIDLLDMQTKRTGGKYRSTRKKNSHTKIKYIVSNIGKYQSL